MLMKFARSSLFVRQFTEVIPASKVNVSLPVRFFSASTQLKNEVKSETKTEVKPKPEATESKVAPTADAQVEKTVVEKTNTGKVEAPIPPPPSSPQQEIEVDEWTQVVDKASGQIYYWNETTGETTELGQPKPLNTKQRRQEELKAVMSGSTPVEEPVEEKIMTGKATVGLVVGIAFGWASQFF
eukprot:CAMPEP_0175066966 /NCGR_PEP_ID=MMETSP0052_2-20121109/16816_1 /TAXON_ID=51329 ORGANISM="Polytomella parva, Strain SAG 63-3" /NCGR_SAMPLE_ID=MMETSP0052_2 /ASSEMBLY_ACC=CAM_ASM_000194 /LENGTH=183 /DNA_ID=CAMNT_0016333755 /DNA_START=42 /DNA_END=593 /DNA_ORIENTATION=+